MDRFIHLWGEYYNLLARVRSGQLMFGREDEQRLQHLREGMPGHLARMRRMFGERFDPQNKIQYVLKNSSTLEAIAAKTPEEKKLLLYQMIRQLEYLKKLKKEQAYRVEEDQPQPTPPEIRRAKMTLSLKKFLPLWKEIIFRPVSFFDALREMKAFSGSFKFVFPLSFFVIIFTVVLGVVMSRAAAVLLWTAVPEFALESSGAISTGKILMSLLTLCVGVGSGVVVLILISATVHYVFALVLSFFVMIVATLGFGALTSATMPALWWISLGKSLSSLLVLCVAGGLGTVVLILISATVRYILYRLLKAECSYFSLVGIGGFALAPMVLLSLSTLYPPVVLLCLAWYVALTVFGTCKALSIKIAQVAVVEGVIVLMAAVLIVAAGITARGCLDRWAARLSDYVVAENMRGTTPKLLSSGAKIEILSHGRGKALGAIRRKGIEKNEVSVAWIPGDKLRFRYVKPLEFLRLELRHLGLSFLEAALWIRRTVWG